MQTLFAPRIVFAAVSQCYVAWQRARERGAAFCPLLHGKAKNTHYGT